VHGLFCEHYFETPYKTKNKNARLNGTYSTYNFRTLYYIKMRMFNDCFVLSMIRFSKDPPNSCD